METIGLYKTCFMAWQPVVILVIINHYSPQDLNVTIMFILIHYFLISLKCACVLQTYYTPAAEKTTKQLREYNRICAKRMWAYRLRLKAKAKAAREQAEAQAQQNQAQQNQAQQGIIH